MNSNTYSKKYRCKTDSQNVAFCILNLLHLEIGNCKNLENLALNPLDSLAATDLQRTIIFI